MQEAVERYLRQVEVLDIPQDHLPLLVLSDNAWSYVATGIRKLQLGRYNHLMWMTRPGEFVTQNVTLCVVPAEKYATDYHKLKFWWNRNWTAEQRRTLINAIEAELLTSAYQRSYDFVAIVGFWIESRLRIPGARKLQLPWKKICSDHSDKLKLVDPDFCLDRPSPPDVNRYLKKSDRYECYGRYAPD